MRQGITTRYLGPTNSKGSRIKALARKANLNMWGTVSGKEMSLTVPYDYSGNSDQVHAKAAQALATKLGWSGLWIAGGKPEEDGNMYVNVDAAVYRATDGVGCGVEGADWFYVAEEVKA